MLRSNQVVLRFGLKRSKLDPSAIRFQIQWKKITEGTPTAKVTVSPLSCFIFHSFPFFSLHKTNSANSSLYLGRWELHSKRRVDQHLSAPKQIRRPWHAPMRCPRMEVCQRVGLRVQPPAVPRALLGAGTAVPRLRFSHFVLLSMVTPPSSTSGMPESFVCTPN